MWRAVIALVLTLSLVLVMAAPAMATPATPTFDPATGPVGTTITVTGNCTGWVASETITAVTVGGTTATHTLTVNGGGNLTGTITVPAVTGGAKAIVINGSASGPQNFPSAFTVTAAATAFDPATGPIGTVIAVTGTGWRASETITAVTVGGVTATHTLTVAASGNLTGNITVPTLAGGAKAIVITGNETSAQTFAGAFTVTAATPTFTPATGPVGTVIAVTGTGWKASETITAVTVGGTTATHTLTVDGTGNLTGNITVPTLAGGAKAIVITGNETSAQTFAGAFTVTAATPTFTPATGPIGTVIAVTGTGWKASETITAVTVGGTTATHTLTVAGW